MSTFKIKARDKKTGTMHDVLCIDDYFGKHKYGYVCGDKVMTKSEFYEQYEELGSQNNE